MNYKKLSPEDREWLRKFNKAYGGRASKEECEALGISEAARKDFYNARYRWRENVKHQPAIVGFQAVEHMTGTDPREAVMSIAHRKMTFSSPNKDEGSKSPAKRLSRGKRTLKKAA